MIDAFKVRIWFPQLNEDIAYLDNAASTLKPVQVVDTLYEVLLYKHSNVHRGDYKWAAESTERYEGARKRIASFIRASPREIVFTSGATAGINMAFQLALANGLIRQDSLIIIGGDSHHSLLLPAREAARRSGAQLYMIPVDSEGKPEWDMLDDLLPDASILAVTHVSNVTGAEAPLDEISKKARRHNVLLILDAAQSVPHMPVSAGLADMMAFSGHKMLGPTGVGVLYINSRLADRLEPSLPGGGTVKGVRVDGGSLTVEWEDPPWRFESGTPPIAEAVALSRAVDILEKLGPTNIRDHDMRLARMIVEELQSIGNVRILGPLEDRIGIVSFTIEGIAPDMTAHMLARKGIAVRAGMHCAQPLHEALGFRLGTVRASTYIYNTIHDIERLVNALRSL